MRFAIEEAARRGMWVMLYDEGMYPSGSASGRVVAENPVYQCRGLDRIEITGDGLPQLAPGQTLIADVTYKGVRYAIVDRPIDSVIRGLHFLNEDADRSSGDEPPEDEPPAADLLNPDATFAFIRQSYDRYYQAFGEHFGSTIRAIFTDEPSLLGRPRERGIMPGTSDILGHLNRYLGYDFTPFLPALWDDGAPEQIMRDFSRAVDQRIETTYYAQLYDWCERHKIALTGHPAEPDATTILRYFPHAGAGHRLALRRAGSAFRARGSAVDAGESGVQRHAPQRAAAQRQRVLRRLRRVAELRGNALAGELAAGARLQPLDPARLLLLGARRASSRAPARRGHPQPLVG